VVILALVLYGVTAKFRSAGRLLNRLVNRLVNRPAVRLKRQVVY